MPSFLSKIHDVFYPWPNVEAVRNGVDNIKNFLEEGEQQTKGKYEALRKIFSGSEVASMFDHINNPAQRGENYSQYKSLANLFAKQAQGYISDAALNNLNSEAERLLKKIDPESVVDSEKLKSVKVEQYLIEGLFSRSDIFSDKTSDLMRNFLNEFSGLVEDQTKSNIEKFLLVQKQHETGCNITRYKECPADIVSSSQVDPTSPNAESYMKKLDQNPSLQEYYRHAAKFVEGISLIVKKSHADEIIKHSAFEQLNRESNNLALAEQKVIEENVVRPMSRNQNSDLLEGNFEMRRTVSKGEDMERSGFQLYTRGVRDPKVSIMMKSTEVEPGCCL